MPAIEAYGLTKRFGSLTAVEDRAHEVVRNFSMGMKRRLEIARSFMHNAKILFLDEPTLGLDPQTRRHIWDYIRRVMRYFATGDVGVLYANPPLKYYPAAAVTMNIIFVIVGFILIILGLLMAYYLTTSYLRAKSE